MMMLQIPDNPDYIGQRFVAGHIEGGSSNGCPALLIAFDPANWKNDTERWIRSNMEIQSIFSTDEANKFIQTYIAPLTAGRSSTKGTKKCRPRGLYSY